MEIWDKKIRENLNGSSYLRTWEEMPYAFKTLIVESISEALRINDVVGQSGQLRAFSKWYEEKYRFEITEDAIKDFESLGS